MTFQTDPAAPPSAIALDILSDPICPWCYIGKARLERAMTARPNHPFSIRWRPFQLNPDMAPEGMDRRAYLERKFGGPAGAARVYGAIEEAAASDGLPIDFAAIKRTPNTLDAHRLIGWAPAGPAQNAVVDALFERYFRPGEDIGDKAVLADVAEEAGLERQGIDVLLAGDADLDAVREEDAAARRAGISGVPTFLVNGRHVVPGAQAADLWVRIIDELLESLAANNAATPSADA